MDKGSVRDKDDKHHGVSGVVLNYDTTTAASPTHSLRCHHFKDCFFLEKNDIRCSTTEEGN
jgi:hypothetical protein